MLVALYLSGFVNLQLLSGNKAAMIELKANRPILICVDLQLGFLQEDS